MWTAIAIAGPVVAMFAAFAVSDWAAAKYHRHCPDCRKEQAE